MHNLFCPEESNATRSIRKSFGESDEALFIVGGDGTYLRALATFGMGSVPPIYAFNSGTVGFLLPLSVCGIEATLDRIKNRQMRFIERRRLHIVSHGKMASNEIVVYSKEHRLSIFRIQIDGAPIELRGDSLTVATMSGSTGHSFSIGGPMLLCDCVVINCGGANRCNFRPIVVSAESRIRIEARGCTGVVDNCFSVDDDLFEIEPGDVYRVAVDDDFNCVQTVPRAFSTK